jgi:glycosyltransferase involved in cell wall biosynthesis
LKILHVIDSGGLYGAENVVLSLMLEHKKQGVHVELASIAEPGVAPKAIEEEAGRLGLAWRRFETQRGPDISSMHRIIAHAETQGTSVIHSHGYKANILLALIGRRGRRIPILATIHGWVSARWFGRMKLFEWIECGLLPRFECVVAVSEAMTKRTLYARRLGKKLKVIRNGIAADQVDDASAENDLGAARSAIDIFANGIPVFAMVGRLSPEKDIGTALRAVEDLKHNGQEVRLVIFGDGPEKEALEVLVSELGLQKNVLFWGYCSCIGGVLNRFRGLIISSLTEGIPLVSLEAMRAGIPVIATKVGGLPEVIIDGKTGILVEPSTPRQLSKSIARLLTDQELAKKFGAAAQLHVSRSFNIVTTAEKYLAQYQALV